MRALDPFFEPGQRLHAFIAGTIDSRIIRRRLAIALLAGGHAFGILPGGIEFGRSRGAASASVEPLQQTGKAMFAEKGSQRFRRHFHQLHVVQRHGQAAVLFQCHEHAAEFSVCAMFEQAFLQLALLHAFRCVERGGQRAVFGDELAGRFRPDAEYAGDVVDRIAHQREYIAHEFRWHTEFLDDFVASDAGIFHRIEHIDATACLDARFEIFFGALADQLHQVLVRTDNRDVPALSRRRAGIGCDHVVRFDVRFFNARQAEGARCVSNQRELWHQIFRRVGPIGLVLVVKIVAETVARLVEYHREMRRAVGFMKIIGQLPQHGGVTVNSANRRAFRVGQRGKAMVGAEDIGRAVNEVEMWFVTHGGGLATGRPIGERLFQPSAIAWKSR